MASLQWTPFKRFGPCHTLQCHADGAKPGFSFWHQDLHKQYLLKLVTIFNLKGRGKLKDRTWGAWEKQKRMFSLCCHWYPCFPSMHWVARPPWPLVWLLQQPKMVAKFFLAQLLGWLQQTNKCWYVLLQFYHKACLETTQLLDCHQVNSQHMRNWKPHIKLVWPLALMLLSTVGSQLQN